MYAVCNSFSLARGTEIENGLYAIAKGKKSDWKKSQQLTQQSEFHSTLRGSFMLKWGLYQACRDGSKSANLWKWYTMLTEWEQKYMTISIDAKKIFVQVQNTFTINFSTS